jgi:hypothetical protein
LAEQGSGSAPAYWVQWLHADSLRLWPLHQGRPDSGFVVFARRQAPHPFDLNCASLMRYWRGDSAYSDSALRRFHFDEFFDLALDGTHRVTLASNSPDFRRYQNWDIDSGRLVLIDGAARHAFTLRNSPAASLSLTQSGNPAPLRLYFSAADSAAIGANAMSRFPNAPYLRTWIAGDTSLYHRSWNYRGLQNQPEQFESFGIFGSDSLWQIVALPRGAETYFPSVAGFRFGLEGKNAALGRFVCFADAAYSFALRLTASSDPGLSPGNFQGTCKIRSAQIAGGISSDSTLALAGDFRLKRASSGSLRSPLWNLP